MNKDLTVGRLGAVLWKFCLPMFGSIIFQQMYNIADSWVADKFVGQNALAAVGNSAGIYRHMVRMAHRLGAGYGHVAVFLPVI